MFDILCTLFLIVGLTHSHCPMRSFSRILTSGLSQDCEMQESNNTIGAGTVQNLTAKCRHHPISEAAGKRFFYYEFSWKHPEPTGKAMSGYRIKISYDIETHVCFRLPPSQNTFIFNNSMGLLYGCMFSIIVTPLPVVYIDGSLDQKSLVVDACPVPAKLSPLPNVIVRYGSSFTFTAAFQNQPIPEASVRWYFSPDIVYCKTRTLLDGQHENPMISENNLTLTVIDVSKQNVGCYVVTADNTLGSPDEQRGYLDLDVTGSITRKRLKSEVERLFLGSLAGVMIVLVIVFFLVFIYRRMRNSSKELEARLLTKNTTKVYISHCMDNRNETFLLAQFCGALKRLGLDVIIDTFSTVKIHNAGGLSQWIPQNMKEADKIVVLLTRKYIDALNSSATEEAYKYLPLDRVRKVHSEINYVNNILQNSTFTTSKHIFVVSKDVDEPEFPPKVPSIKKLYKFPRNFDVEKNSTFRSIADALLENPT